MQSLQYIIRSFAFHTQIGDNDSERKWKESKQNNVCPETHLLKTPSAFQVCFGACALSTSQLNKWWARGAEASQSVTKCFDTKNMSWVAGSKTCGSLGTWFVFSTPLQSQITFERPSHWWKRVECQAARSRGRSIVVHPGFWVTAKYRFKIYYAKAKPRN